MFENQPGNELDKVVVEGDASASIKDGGVRVPNEVRGDHLQNTYAVRTQADTNGSNVLDTKRGSDCLRVLNGK